jgi:hypothetical protein
MLWLLCLLSSADLAACPSLNACRVFNFNF